MGTTRLWNNLQQTCPKPKDRKTKISNLLTQLLRQYNFILNHTDLEDRDPFEHICVILVRAFALSMVDRGLSNGIVKSKTLTYGYLWWFSSSGPTVLFARLYTFHFQTFAGHVTVPLICNYWFYLYLLFLAKHTALRIKCKDWLARNQDNVSMWIDMSIHGLLFQWTSTIKIQLRVLV